MRNLTKLTLVQTVVIAVVVAVLGGMGGVAQAGEPVRYNTTAYEAALFPLANNTIEVWGNCDAETCQLVAIIDVTSVGDQQRFTTGAVGGWYADVVYVGDSADDDARYQINVYGNGRLIDSALQIEMDAEIWDLVRSADDVVLFSADM